VPHQGEICGFLNFLKGVDLVSDSGEIFEAKLKIFN
jgi:hypothetical protein